MPRYIVERSLPEGPKIPVNVEGAESQPWRSRTEMYGRISRYLLHERDDLRGIELAFSYADKAKVLESIAQFAFEKNLNYFTLPTQQAA